ncbi:MAG: class I SAM-dependent methyltransferase [Patescibacteria group bacterium]
MRKNHLSYLSDPLSGTSFELQILKEDSQHVEAGILKNDTTWYPIISGIPRIMVAELRENLLQTRYEFFHEYKDLLPQDVREEWQASLDRIKDFDAFITHQKKTAESFAYEWKYIYKENPYEKQNFLHFLTPYIKESDLKGKLTLDIGCGSGRFTKWAALSGTNVSFGTDLGESVEVAYEMTHHLPNVCIVQADIYAMPFTGKFDIAYSIGVLHHLPKPKDGFTKLPPVLKKGGRMLIWVYNRRNNARALYFYEPLRDLLKNLPKPLLYKLCYIPGLAIHIINMLTHILNWYGFKKLAKKVPFSYYANFPFNMKLNDAFDVLATPKSNYYYVEEIREWFDSAKLQSIEAFEHPEAGITCTGIYEF